MIKCFAVILHVTVYSIQCTALPYYHGEYEKCRKKLWQFMLSHGIIILPHEVRVDIDYEHVFEVRNIISGTISILWKGL